MRSVFSLNAYRDMIHWLRAAGYSFELFSRFGLCGKPNMRRVVLLRHDIDISPPLALLFAKVEADLGIRATYFFMSRNPLYNILSSEVQDVIRCIRDMGHDVGLHAQGRYKSELLRDIALWPGLVGVETKIVSIHCPTEEQLDRTFRLSVPHTYESRFFRDIDYFSDSSGRWGNRAPTDRITGRSMQILTHPVWWVQSEKIGPLTALLRALNTRASGDAILQPMYEDWNHAS